MSLPAGDLHHLAHRDDPAVQVRADDRLRLRGERGFEVRGVELPVVGVDVDQDGLRADRVDGEEVRFVVVGGHYDFVARADAERRSAASTASVPLAQVSACGTS